jgi:hypothetical protein
MFGKMIYFNTGLVHRAAQLELTRRQALVLAGAAMIAPALPALATGEIGQVLEMKGNVLKSQDNAGATKVGIGEALNNNDLLKTGKNSFVSMQLGDTKIVMGEDTELLLDSFLADQGGTLDLVSGDMVFDRPEGLPKIDLTVRTVFGQIGVRGTKFFTGHSGGSLAVFVEHGLVEVRSGMTARKVGAGEGVDIAVDKKTRSLFGANISSNKAWGKSRIEEAYRKVGLMAL